MSKLLLLVQTQADVQHLDAAAKAILNSAITGVWVVFSPAITVNTSEAAAKLDTEIATLKTAERQAADRSDYAAAAGYKTQREGKELDRAQALRDAWKLAPAEERQARTKAIFSPFGDQLKTKNLNVRITGHSDHYERDQWVAMLNSLSGVWFKEFTPGGFMIAWPEAVETMLPIGMTNVGAVLEAAIEKKEVVQKPKSRREELEATHHMSLRPIAKALNIDLTGKGTPEIIEAILAAEAAPKAAPETVDAY